MGNYVHKLLTHNDESKKDETKTQPSTEDKIVEKDEMCTPPVTQRKLPTDPRSVTAGIERTPIEVNCTPVGHSKRAISAIPKYLQSKPYLETDLDKVMPATPRKRGIPRILEGTPSRNPCMQNQSAQGYLTPTVNVVNRSKLITPTDIERYNILGLDPRSPAADFDRTPILTPRSIDRLRARSQENLVRRGSYESDVYYNRYSYCETSSSFNMPETQTLPDMAAHVLKSLSLANIDCRDRMNESGSSCSSHLSQTETVSENGEEITVIENPVLKYAGINREICVSSISPNQKIFAEEDKLEDETTTACEDNYNRVAQQKQITYNDNDKIRVWRDSISSEEVEEVVESETEVTKEKNTELPKGEVIITFDDDSIVKDTPLLKVNKLDNHYPIKTDIVIGKKKKTFKSDGKALTDESKTRTPLGNRSNNGQRQTLLSKSPQQLFRNKAIPPRMLQENTPPHKRYIAKSKLNGA